MGLMWKSLQVLSQALLASGGFETVFLRALGWMIYMYGCV